MATTPTQNPVPSESAVDLKFNAGKIDEFVTSFLLKYTDRFGIDHLTIEGLKDIVDRSIKAFGFITIDSFEDGATLTNSSQVLRWESNGEYYRWDGSFPKVVPSGSTPATSGGIGDGAWLSVGDAVLRNQLFSTSGSNLVGYNDTETYGSNTVGNKLHNLSELTENKFSNREIVITDAPYNAVGDYNPATNTGTDNTAAIQAAVNACPIGGCVVIPTGRFRITDAIRITKPMTIKGYSPGSFVNALGGSMIAQSNTTKNAFTMVASTANYAFSQYGIIDVHFADLTITGPSLASKAVIGIGVDTTINSGDFHIRGFTYSNVHIRYFKVAVQLAGIAYLNNFYGGTMTWCDNGLVCAKATASDVGGQTRMFGTSITQMISTCVSFFEDSQSGELSVFGCTLSESQYGIRANAWASISVYGSMFESLTNEASNGAGIYIDINSANPSTGGNRVITGNHFLSNNKDIWFNKTSSGGALGGFNCSAYIDANKFESSSSIVITVPSGHLGIDSDSFVIGAANTGVNNGAFDPSQIVGLLYAHKIKNRRVVYRLTFGASGTNSYILPLGMVVTKARAYLTIGSGGATIINIGDPALINRYMAINAQTQVVNTFVNWTETVPQTGVFDIYTKQLQITTTAGWLGSTGVFEIEGYIPQNL